MTDMETMAGKVALVARRKDEETGEVKFTGVKLEGRDAWLNFSDYAKGPVEIPEQGDNVKLGIAQSKNGKWYIQTCEIQHKGPQSSFEDGHVPTSGKDLSIVRQVSIKSATKTVCARIARGEYVNSTDKNFSIATDIVAIAQTLERAMSRNEIEFE